MAKQDDYIRYTVRLPRQIYADLEAHAGAKNISINAELIQRLNEVIAERPSPDQEFLKVPVPTDLYNHLCIMSLVFDDQYATLNDYIVGVLSNESKIGGSTKKIRALEKDMESLKDDNERWKSLFSNSIISNKAMFIILKSICALIANHDGDMPTNVRSTAQSILENLSEPFIPEI